MYHRTRNTEVHFDRFANMVNNNLNIVCFANINILLFIHVSFKKQNQGEHDYVVHNHVHLVFSMLLMKYSLKNVTQCIILNFFMVLPLKMCKSVLELCSYLGI